MDWSCHFEKKKNHLFYKDSNDLEVRENEIRK